MRYLILFFVFLLTYSCKTKIEKPNFLIGNWKRLNDSIGKSTYENWNKNFSGLGYTLKGKDTIFKENLAIVSINDEQSLVVTGVNEKPTYFKVTSLTENSITCENEQNQFPKKIRYWLENKQLHAKVSNDDFAINFVFEKVN